MTAASARRAVRPRLAAAGWPGLAAWRLLRLELRHNAMPWLAPVVAALFWLTMYREVVAMPPLWNVRTASMQASALADFAAPVAGAAAWMGSRDARRRLGDLMAVTSRPRPARLLATWAATAVWAMAGCLACVAVLYGITARQAAWGGPLWWPAAVVAASLPALCALGFAAGTVLPSRLTAPLTAVASFFLLALSTQLITGSQSYWQVSPLVAAPWDIGPDAGTGTFYPYLPDLAIAQVMFLAGLTLAVLGALALPAGAAGRRARQSAAAVTAAGLLAAGTAVALAGTGRLASHGMIDIPALHDAASDRPIRFTPVCSHGVIPVCLNPAYASYLAPAAAALAPVLREISGLPGAPVRISQAAATYHQGPGNSVGVSLAGPVLRGRPPVLRLLLPDQLLGPAMTGGELAAAVRSGTGPGILAAVIGDGPGASAAQRAVTAALMMAVSLNPQSRQLPERTGPVRLGRPPRPSQTVLPSPLPQPMLSPVPPEPAPGSPAYAAARRFAALPASARRAWLAAHLAALRAGQITLAQLP